MQTDHWNTSTINFIAPHVERAGERVQIASGFFTIQGYDLLRHALVGKAVQIMVGFDEQSRDKLKELLIDEIMAYLSQWDVEDRRQAVMDLIQRIERGRFQIIEHRQTDILDARARNRDHAKIMILDQKVVLIGSCNLTMSGLKQNAEGMGVIDTPDRVAYYRERFDTYWNAEDTVDLTEELLARLRAWLALVDPFDVYLKTIQIFLPDEEFEAPRDSYKMPVHYQQVVIARLLRQLTTYRGAMLVASTGLGKTIMATHTALLLKQDRKIHNVVVFAPVQVQPDWHRAMHSAGIHARIMTRNTLDRKPGGKGKKSQELAEILELVDDKHLIIIDESQYFRNRTRASDGKIRA